MLTANMNDTCVMPKEDIKYIFECWFRKGSPILSMLSESMNDQ